MPLYPVNLNVKNRHCLVVGGGEVALRKVFALLEYGAIVCVVSPEVRKEILKLAESQKIELRQRGYQETDMLAMFLVFAATNDQIVQAQIVRDSRKHHVLLNSADNPEECDFQVPAHFHRGNFQIAISTGGGSPAFSRMVRQELENYFGDEYQYTVCLLGLIREQIVSKTRASAANRKILNNILQEGLVQCIKDGDWLKLQGVLASHLPDGIEAEHIIQQFFQTCLSEVNTVPNPTNVVAE